MFKAGFHVLCRISLYSISPWEFPCFPKSERDPLGHKIVRKWNLMIGPSNCASAFDILLPASWPPKSDCQGPLSCLWVRKGLPSGVGNLWTTTAPDTTWRRCRMPRRKMRPRLPRLKKKKEKNLVKPSCPPSPRNGGRGLGQAGFKKW